AQTVQLGASGVPAGVTASFSPASVTAGGQSTLTLATTGQAVSGTYSITVTGTGPSGSHSTTYALTVTGGNGNQCTAAPWNSGAIYTGGQQVSHEGHTWKAKWWTTGEEPGTTGQWG
ncbi:carbohydrate-binding protein, partial [Streptomyces sp. NPDC060131]